MPRRRDMDELQDEIQQLFTDLWQVPRFAGLRRGYRPAVDAYSCGDPPRIVVVVELAGVDRSDVQVDAGPHELTVRGQRRRQRGGTRYHLMELDYGPFERTLHLAEEVDVEAATADYRQGLLTVVLPLAERTQGTGTVQIEVKAGRQELEQE